MGPQVGLVICPWHGLGIGLPGLLTVDLRGGRMVRPRDGLAAGPPGHGLVPNRRSCPATDLVGGLMPRSGLVICCARGLVIGRCGHLMSDPGGNPMVHLRDGPAVHPVGSPAIDLGGG